MIGMAMLGLLPAVHFNATGAQAARGPWPLFGVPASALESDQVDGAANRVEAVVYTTLRPASWDIYLTNYLGQSAVFVFLFYGVGLGLAGRVGIGIATLLAVMLYLLQIRFSRWWLTRYRFGPAEWIWRCVTYGTRITIRRAEPERV